MSQQQRRWGIIGLGIGVILGIIGWRYRQQHGYRARKDLAKDAVRAILAQASTEQPLMTSLEAALHEAVNASQEPTPPAQPTSPAYPVIGNRRTLVFHEASSAHLPAEDNRRLFATAADALHAGYRPANDD